MNFILVIQFNVCFICEAVLSLDKQYVDYTEQTNKNLATKY